MPVHTLKISGSEAMRQAWETADTYLGAAIRQIDQRLGDGYAKKNPALIGVFMQVAAQDFHTAQHLAHGENIAAAVEELASAVSNGADEIADCLLKAAK